MKKQVAYAGRGENREMTGVKKQWAYAGRGEKREMPWLENQGVYAGCGEKRECRGFEEIGGVIPRRGEKRGMPGIFVKNGV